MLTQQSVRKLFIHIHLRYLGIFLKIGTQKLYFSEKCYLILLFSLYLYRTTLNTTGLFDLKLVVKQLLVECICIF